jgi:hypothetical protein
MSDIYCELCVKENPKDYTPLIYHRYTCKKCDRLIHSLKGIGYKLIPKTPIPKGYRMVDASELKAGNFVKCMSKDREILSGRIHCIVNGTEFSIEDGGRFFIVYSYGTTFYVKEHTADPDTELIAPHILRDETVDFLELELETLRHKKDETEVELKKEKAESATLKVKLDLLQKEKDEADANLKLLQEKLDKKRKLFLKNAKDVPQEILNIADDWGFFDLISMFRAVFKSDVDIEHLNKFIADSELEDIIEKDAPVKHTALHTFTGAALFTSTLRLFHELHLKKVYKLLTNYFQANPKMLFPINESVVICIEEVQ